MLRHSLIPLMLLASVAHAAPLTLGVVLDEDEPVTDPATAHSPTKSRNRSASRCVCKE